jgi:hypothetical protein
MVKLQEIIKVHNPRKQEFKKHVAKEGRWTLPPNFELNHEIAQVFEAIEKTHGNYFITGKPGVGKTACNDYCCINTEKNVVVLAPTGVAALKAGGQTIHSFFKFPHNRFILPKDIKVVHGVNMKEIDTIIIDECSMLRADILDYIDDSLRLNRGCDVPFGGIQMFLTGDLYQLAPVMSQEDRWIIEGLYASPFFFDSNIYREMNLKMIELIKLYRQKDPAFLALLDKIRKNEADDADLKILNQLVCAGNETQDKGVLTLTARNPEADEINERCLSRISEKEHHFRAEVSDMYGWDYPADIVLRLKKSAQVMFVRNDLAGRWVNGTMGEVVGIDDEAIRVVANGNEHIVERTTWDKPKYGSKGGAVGESDVMETFTQYPLKLAWAVTIHKSQGQTFEKVIIDLGDGAFAHGQTHVALSRCTTFEGMRLRKAITRKDIILDKRIVNFMKKATGETK